MDDDDWTTVQKKKGARKPIVTTESRSQVEPQQVARSSFRPTSAPKKSDLDQVVLRRLLPHPQSDVGSKLKGDKYYQVCVMFLPPMFPPSLPVKEGY